MGDTSTSIPANSSGGSPHSPSVKSFPKKGQHRGIKQQAPLTPTSWKVALAVSFLFTALFLTITLLSAKYGVPDWAPSWTQTALWGITGTYIGGQVLFSLFMIVNHFSEKQIRAKMQLLHDPITDPSDSEPEDEGGAPPLKKEANKSQSRAKDKEKEREIESEEEPQPAPELNSRELQDRIARSPLYPYGSPILFGEEDQEIRVAPIMGNLMHPDQPPAELFKPLHVLQLPMIGTCNKWNRQGLLMAVRLPDSQIETFHEEIRGLFQSKTIPRSKKTLLDQAECYFLVYDNTRYKDKKNVRNLYMQPMALVEGKGVEPMKKKEGVQAVIETILCRPSGIYQGFQDESRIPIHELWKVPPLTTMETESQPYLPAESTFCIETEEGREGGKTVEKMVPISTFEVGTVFRREGRKVAVALKIVVMNDAEDIESQKLIRALEMVSRGNVTMDGFLRSLSNDKFAPLPEIVGAFTHPSNQVTEHS